MRRDLLEMSTCASVAAVVLSIAMLINALVYRLYEISSLFTACFLVGLVGFCISRYKLRKIEDEEYEKTRQKEFEEEAKWRRMEQEFQEQKRREEFYRRSQEANYQYQWYGAGYDDYQQSKNTRSDNIKEAYAFFGINYGSGVDEVKKAYRKLALKYHPDRGGSEEKFKQLVRYRDILYKYLNVIK